MTVAPGRDELRVPRHERLDDAHANGVVVGDDAPDLVDAAERVDGARQVEVVRCGVERLVLRVDHVEIHDTTVGEERTARDHLCAAVDVLEAAAVERKLVGVLAEQRGAGLVRLVNEPVEQSAGHHLAARHLGAEHRDRRGHALARRRGKRAVVENDNLGVQAFKLLLLRRLQRVRVDG